MRNGRDLGGKRKTRTKERVGPVATNPDNLGNINNKEEGGGAQGTQGLSKNYYSRECVPSVASDQRFS